MAIGIKTQKDCLITEAEITLPTDLNALDQLMRSIKATGRIVAIYNQGGIQGVSVEQKSRIPARSSEQIREILGVGTRELECE